MEEYGKTIQVIALLLFGVLLVLGKIQFWMGIFLIGLLLSTFLGRFYCGYFCPINTVMEVIDDNAKKKKRIRRKFPEIIKRPWVRFAGLGLFLGTMIFVFKTGRKLPVLPILFLLGIILTLFFKPSLWHRYLCPYGTLLSIFSRRNKKGYIVTDAGCIRCGLCVNTCPSDAIYWEDKSKEPVIIKNECLVCGKCKKICPTDAIK